MFFNYLRVYRIKEFFANIRVKLSVNRNQMELWFSRQCDSFKKQCNLQLQTTYLLRARLRERISGSYFKENSLSKNCAVALRAAVREAHATALEKKKSWSYGISKLTCHPTKHTPLHCTMATFPSTEQDNTKSQGGKKLGRHKLKTIEVKAASYSENFQQMNRGNKK